MPGINFTGLASGIDTGSIVDQLVAVERIPISRLTNRKTAAEKRISTLSDLSTKLKALKTAAEALDRPGELVPLAGKSSDETKVKLNGTPSQSGSWAINVTALATAEATRSRGFATKDAGAVSDGTLSVTVGADAPIDIAYSASDSLDAIAERINSSGARVNAQVVHDGTSYRMLVTGKETGAVNAITFTDSGGLGMADTGAQIMSATDAQLTVGNLPVTRPGNTVEGIVPGVTLDLKAVGSSTVTAARDGDAQKGLVQKFVDAYNAVATVISKQLTYSGTQKGEDTLFGDSALQGLQRRMGNTIASAFAHSSSTTTLRDFGVKLQNDGTITFDTAAFATAVDANPAQLEHIFVGQGGGTALAAAVTTLANDYTASGTGTLEAKKTGLQSLIKGFTTQIDKIEDGAVALGDRLRLQFSRLEQTMSGLQGQLSYISRIG